MFKVLLTDIVGVLRFRLLLGEMLPVGLLLLLLLLLLLFLLLLLLLLGIFLLIEGVVLSTLLQRSIGVSVSTDIRGFLRSG